MNQIQAFNGPLAKTGAARGVSHPGFEVDHILSRLMTLRAMYVNRCSCRWCVTTMVFVGPLRLAGANAPDSLGAIPLAESTQSIAQRFRD